MKFTIRSFNQGECVDYVRQRARIILPVPPDPDRKTNEYDGCDKFTANAV